MAQDQELELFRKELHEISDENNETQHTIELKRLASRIISYKRKHPNQ